MQKLIVEGDSLIFICFLKKLIHGYAIGKISTSWRLESGLEHLRKLLTSINVVIPSHVICMTNKLADRRANESAMDQNHNQDIN
jgi:hypothetical protein